LFSALFLYLFTLTLSELSIWGIICIRDSLNCFLGKFAPKFEFYSFPCLCSNLRSDSWFIFCGNWLDASDFLTGLLSNIRDSCSYSWFLRTFLAYCLPVPRADSPSDSLPQKGLLVLALDVRGLLLRWWWSSFRLAWIESCGFSSLKLRPPRPPVVDTTETLLAFV